MKIYVVGSSKNKFLPLDDIREKFLIDEKHEGDNIDFLNPWYCELTGLYYLWKHVDDDIVGLEHYRRYFINDKGNLLNENEIKDILKDNDVIVHCSSTNKNDIWTKCREKKMPLFKRYLILIKTFYPEMYASYADYIKKSSYIIQNNMFICRKEIITEYLSFLFNSLEDFYKAEKHFKKLALREIGYIAEYFFGAYLDYKKYKLFNSKQNFNGVIR